MSHSIQDERLELTLAEKDLIQNTKTLKSAIKYIHNRGDYESIYQACLVIKECQKKLDLILTGEYIGE